MKNKLYVMLLAGAISGCAKVTADTGIAIPINPTAVNSSAAFEEQGIVTGKFGPGHLGATYAQPVNKLGGNSSTDTSIKLGGNTATYAPSPLENKLRALARFLNELANMLSFFRQNEPVVFKRYFSFPEDVVSNASSEEIPKIKG